jgi:hypothetical protein
VLVSLPITSFRYLPFMGAGTVVRPLALYPLAALLLVLFLMFLRKVLQFLSRCVRQLNLLRAAGGQKCKRKKRGRPRANRSSRHKPNLLRKGGKAANCPRNRTAQGVRIWYAKSPAIARSAEHARRKTRSCRAICSMFLTSISTIALAISPL